MKKSNKLAGIVSTNSTTYSDGPPSLDPKTQSLDYELASAHYTSKGEEFLGTYDLVLDATVARCIYGFSAAPVSATVTITNSDGGVQKVATTLLNERGGWLHLGAYGFGFSSPTLKVKFIQEKVVTEASNSITSKKNTITCVKGKTTKKVTAVNPKCPTGYKKK